MENLIDIEKSQAKVTESLKNEIYLLKQRMEKSDATKEDAVNDIKSNNFGFKNFENETVLGKLQDDFEGITKKLSHVDSNLKGLGQTMNSKINKEIYKLYTKRYPERC